jgi:hypothetical protein
MIASTIDPPASDAFRQMVRMIAETHLRAEERAKATHGRFNIFSTLLRENDEVRLHTRFLHCLLDPQGLHDCGPLFLDLFLKMLADFPGFDDADEEVPFYFPAAGAWTVGKETGRSSGFGQIDLLLEHREVGIAIENKIHALEGTGQLASYAKFLRGRYGKNASLIFLTLDGRKSFTHEGADYVRISYRHHILRWLESCLRDTYSIIPVNQMLLQYREVVRKLTGQTMQAAMMKPIAEFVTNHSEIIRYRAQWNAAVEEAKSRFMDRIGESLIESLGSDFQVGFDPENENDRFSTQNSGIIIRRKDGGGIVPGRFSVYVENDCDVLAAGVFVDYEKNKLSGEESHWVESIKAMWADDSEWLESIEIGPTPAWPLGWINLLDDLSDEGFAKIMEEPFTRLIERLTERIRSYLTSLEIVCLKVSK